jgi:flagellin-like hook-associated protein FlgL
MSSDVVLTAALRNNLLSLQNTQRLIDDTQLKLATGLKVNSALDNPQNFFSAQSLNNRAGDLGRLLDGISQSIRTIEVANTGVESLTTLVEQADSIVQSARDVLAASEGESRVTGNVDLDAVTDLTTLGTIANNDAFTISTVAADGLEITETVTVNTGDTAASLAAKITNAFADNQDSEISARVNSDGFFEIFSDNGRSFRIEGSATFDTADFGSLGLSNFVRDEANAATVGATTIVSGDTITSRQIFENPGDLIEAGDLVAGTYQDVDGTDVVSTLTGATITFEVNGGAGTTDAAIVIAATTTFQDVIDQINSDTTVNDLVEASFDSKNGQISIKSISGDTDTVSVAVTGGAAGSVLNVGFGDDSSNFDPLVAGAAQERVYAFSTGSAELENLAGDYNEVRNQIDRIVVDANYRGVNLLNGDDLTTFFNEDLTSSLTTSGVDFTSNGLGISETTFANSAIVEAASAEIRTALDDVRSFGSSLPNNLSIIQTRRDFTESTINTLTSGADDLTVADQNEEGANLLALQTRQALGVTSLSLASQSQQSVLRLF